MSFQSNRRFRNYVSSTIAILLAAVSTIVDAKDVFLTIGGGPVRSSNQVSLEKNVLLFERTLAGLRGTECSHDIFFSNGNDSGKDVKLVNPQSVPKANRLMAELFGSQDNLGLTYRPHEIDNVRAAASPAHIRDWFSTVGNDLTSGDRLVIYVTAHGQRSESQRDQYNSTIAMWGNTSLKMTEFVELLDGLERNVDVIVVMVQCYAGGFSRFIFNEGDPKKGLSPQRRVGFFATVHDEPASGCTAEMDEANYSEYSSYFWSAFTGRDRSGSAIDVPDYNHDGLVSFDEAHAYTVLVSDTIDIPMKTSGEFLSTYGKFGDGDPKLLSDDESFSVILQCATHSQKAILNGLSQQLALSGPDRIASALREIRSRRRGTEKWWAAKHSRPRKTAAAHCKRYQAALAGTQQCAEPNGHVTVDGPEG